MQIQFIPQKKKGCLDFIMQCMTPTEATGAEPPMRRWVLAGMPMLEQTCAKYPDWELQKMALRKQLGKMWDLHVADIEKSVKTHNKYFSDAKVKKLIRAFSDAFCVDCDKIMRGCVTGEININPICPRDIKNKSFSIPFYYTPEYTMQTAIHETIHFIWFRIWKRHFKDSWDEYEAPSLKWLLSEMVVDPIARYSDLANFCTERVDGDTMAYSYFYDVKVGSKPILDTLGEMYKNNSITDFMDLAWQYVQTHEKELIKQIEIAKNPKPKAQRTQKSTSR